MNQLSVYRLAKNILTLLCSVALGALPMLGAAQSAPAENTSNRQTAHKLYFALGGEQAYRLGAQVANLDGITATVELRSFDAAGTVIGQPINQEIAPNSSQTYFPILSGNVATLLVSSPQKISGIANILASNATAFGSYAVTGQYTNTILLPLLFKNNGGYNTFLIVQNGGATATDVSLSYSDGTSAQATIAANTAAIFRQADEPHTQAVFAGKVTSAAQPIAAQVIQTDGKIIFAYNGFIDGSPDLIFPLVNIGQILTGIQIQNIGAQTSDITVTYTPSGAGAACSETRSIEAGKSKTFALSTFVDGNSSNCQASARFVGSGRVTGNSTGQPLTAIVNQLLPGKNGGSYQAFRPEDAANTLVLPLIMDRNGGFFSGFSVMNVGATATEVKCTFSNSVYTVSSTVAPGKALVDLQNNKLGERYIGSATCSATDPQGRLVGIVNQLGANLNQDQLLVYEAVGR